MSRSEHFYIILVLIALTAVGTFGYSYLEGWSLHDSLYMTIITLTTTGFQEVHQMSNSGRNLTMFLLLVGLVTVAYSVSLIMNDLLAISFDSRRKRKMENQIDQLTNHTIICGHGRMGKIIAEEIFKTHNNFLIIEKDPTKIAQLQKTNYKFIEGDCTQDEVLKKSRISQAKVLVSMIDSDTDALYLALAARTLNSNLQIIVRASEEQAKPKILRAGANVVVLPILMSGIKVAHTILNPSIEDYIDLSGINNQSAHQYFQIADLLVMSYPKIAQQKISSISFENYKLILIGVRKKNNEFIFSPDPNYQLNLEDTVLTLGTQEAYQAFLTQFRT